MGSLQKLSMHITYTTNYIDECENDRFEEESINHAAILIINVLTAML